jgi:uncharacterized protein (DUF4415 family)
MKKLTNRQKQTELDAIAAIPDDEIDTSDIPELRAEQLKHAFRGQMYRPIKKPVTMRLDADVIAWLKQAGPGYQTKANLLLRELMIRSLRGNEQTRTQATSAVRERKQSSAGR